jgi:LmbE family N-acetylglucosaminyl deacetylase
MPVESPQPTRTDFLRALAGASLAPGISQAQTATSAPRKLLIVVAHPDDEYAFAATAYRLVRELGWTADQLIVTDGESGYRYSTLAEVYYGIALTNAPDARAHLPAIRKDEAMRAGKVLGIRRHYFLEQKDSGFATNAATADASHWDRAQVLSRISTLLARERYSAVFTLLPTAETHGHHRAATLLALEAVARMPATGRPLIFGAEPRADSDPAGSFSASPSEPLAATVDAAPVFTFDRARAFGFRDALNYQIVVNWVIAEHKSQGLFQKENGAHRFEQFWLFQASGDGAIERTGKVFAQCGAAPSTQ